MAISPFRLWRQTINQLEEVRKADLFHVVAEESNDNDQQIVSVMCECTMEELHFVLIRTESATCTFDCVKLETRDACKALTALLTNK